VPLPVPEPGLVISYSYLWRAEYEQGQEEGVKDRPCAVILIVKDAAGEWVVTVVPITHNPPRHRGDGVEIPFAVKRRLGLDEARSWAIVNEVNRFVWPGPDLRPVTRGDPERFEYGLLPPSLFRQIRDRLVAAAAAQRLQTVPRSE
jgi:hypothetical protein